MSAIEPKQDAPYFEQTVEFLGRCRECERVFAMDVWLFGETTVQTVTLTMPCPECGAVADATAECDA